LRKETGIHTASEAIELVTTLWPFREPPLKMRLLLEELLGPSER
jgi:hypothetical protein